MNPTLLIMLAAMVGLMFFTQRQQKKQAEQRQKQLSELQKGDEVVTIGGLYGLVDEIDTKGQKIVLDVDGVYLTFELAAIKRTVAKAAVVEEVSPLEEAETAVETAIEE